MCVRACACLGAACMFWGVVYVCACVPAYKCVVSDFARGPSGFSTSTTRYIDHIDHMNTSTHALVT